MSEKVAGKLIVFSAPSGAGKTTIVREVMKVVPNLSFSVSATSRSPRVGEVEGLDYYFLSVEDFKLRIKQNAFVEWEEVYPDRFYGTLKMEVERIRNEGRNVLFDVDVLGGLNIKKLFGTEALALFIAPPTIDELRSRLITRASDTTEDIEIRLKKAAYEMSFSNQFDEVIINHDLQKAVKEVVGVIKSFLSKN
ncbi:MAG: guanylate kinase [Bacteroidales bacterium]|nr:guanylate kinase [Bacteroidales bacterium]